MAEFISNHLWTIWSIVTAVCLLSELTTGGLYLLCLAFGAFLTTILSLFIDSYLVLIAIFSIISIISLFFVRPILRKSWNKEKSNLKSNYEAVVGEIGTVTESIPVNGYGRVIARGDDWKAQSEDNSSIEKGSRVVVTNIEGLIITVKLK